jgi:GLPGLI family protein
MSFDYSTIELEPAIYLISYSLEFRQDSQNLDYIRYEDMLLLKGNNVSLFMSKNLYLYDSLMRTIANQSEFQKLLQNRSIPFPKLMYRIYKNHPSGKLTYTEHIPSNTFKYEENLDVFSWQIYEDTETIAGFPVQKAITEFGGRIWIAWFCTKVPINDGPYKFNGLPGLIIKIHDSENHYVFELTSIKKTQHEIMIDILQREYIVTTKQEFFKAKDSFYGNIISRAKDAGLSSESQQTAARNVQEKNNPIEIKRD